MPLTPWRVLVSLVLAASVMISAGTLRAADAVQPETTASLVQALVQREDSLQNLLKLKP